MRAEIKYPNGTVVEARVEKDGRKWIIGGDVLAAYKGCKVFIYKDGMIFWLKGNRLIFQDYEG